MGWVHGGGLSPARGENPPGCLTELLSEIGDHRTGRSCGDGERPAEDGEVDNLCTADAGRPCCVEEGGKRRSDGRGGERQHERFVRRR